MTAETPGETHPKWSWNFDFGQMVTIGVGLASVVGFWYSQVDKIDDNQETLTLHELRMDRMEVKMRQDLESTERRIISSIEDMKNDVRWLVRAQGQRQWVEDRLEEGQR